MQNAARFNELGISQLVTSLKFGNKIVAPQKNATADHRKDRDCDPDYNPEHDEPDLCNTNNPKVLILSLYLCLSCA